MKLEKGQTMLFQGDSITDCARDREDPKGMGYGYAMMFPAVMNTLYPEMEYTFYNRGIGGDCSWDLVDRWQGDCIDLKPDVVSIMIGINNINRRMDLELFDEPEEELLAKYRSDMEILLSRTRDELGAKIILIEPFSPADGNKTEHHRLVLEEIKILKELAPKYNAEYIVMDEIYQQAFEKRPVAFWLPDRLHPSEAGHMLIARELLKAFGVTMQ